ncbi:MAG: nucleoside 2-deoxyribosyltransferase [Erysipelotrichaceae bacterium]|nr:nucleoside 2-deoxyribosyltransferase [Erysipelotrichaceae bacterium]
MFIDREGKVRKPVIYLADFEMFLPTCEETVKYWKEVCDKYGFIGMFPGDGDPVEPGDNFWQRVFNSDYGHMLKCDVCFAQLDDWRGHEPDSGTLWELGWYVALGYPSYGFYGGPKTLLERKIERTEEDGVFYDSEGYAIEDKEYGFDNMLTLVKVADSFENACKLARADFDKQLIEAGYEPYKVKE